MEQFDTLLESLTVKEMLIYTAELKVRHPNLAQMNNRSRTCTALGLFAETDVGELRREDAESGGTDAQDESDDHAG